MHQDFRKRETPSLQEQSGFIRFGGLTDYQSHGQSTNCKMNKVVLSVVEQGKTVSLYFYITTDHKRVELDLLEEIKTQYNVKSN